MAQLLTFTITRHNIPGLTTHTLFHCSTTEREEKGKKKRWPLLGYRALLTLCGRFPPFTSPVIFSNGKTAKFKNILCVFFCVSLMTPICSGSPCLQQTPLHVRVVTIKK
ncbi:hypothetical protein E3U43_021709 [Larimichthys crocea]|uniref:Uncharacterized protein n=1 Tax=Larimichthys crocea TaxID=215358 RepID=A0ACD3R6P6_LARCR|nr:hypothetical protein E3U43_021709 [Larimichthys crocea]